MPSGDVMKTWAREIVAAHPDHPARSLARKLQKRARGAITLEQARSRIRVQLGAAGKQKRRLASRPRPLRAAGMIYAPPASVAETWTPRVLEVVGPVGIISDVHVPYHDETAVAAAVDYLAEAGILGLVLNGDIADFYAISRYMKDPSQRDFRGELEAVRQFIGWIRERFPKIPIVYKVGNHEERWNHWIWQHAPEISDEPLTSLVAWLHLEQHGVELVDDRRPIMLGRLPVLHGHEKGMGISAPVNQARGTFLRLNHTCLEGHGHRTSTHVESDMFHREIATWSTGCLCDLRPDYAVYNKWNHGFAIVNVHADGEFDVQNLRIKGGTVRQS